MTEDLKGVFFLPWRASRAAFGNLDQQILGPVRRTKQRSSPGFERKICVAPSAALRRSAPRALVHLHV